MTDWVVVFLVICGAMWIAFSFTPKTKPAPDLGQSLQQVQIAMLFFILAMLRSMK